MHDNTKNWSNYHAARKQITLEANADIDIETLWSAIQEGLTGLEASIIDIKEEAEIYGNKS